MSSKLWRAGLLLLLAGGVGGLASACADYIEPLPTRSKLHFPVGLTLHPQGRYLYVVNSNFDARYSAELGGTVAVVDTQTLQILEQGTPYIPSFGGDIMLNDAGTRAYVTARKGDSLIALDVANGEGVAAGSALSCKDDQGQASSDSTPCVIRRVPDQKSGARVPADPMGLWVSTIKRQASAQDPEVDVDVVALSHLSGTLVSALALPQGQIAAASLQSAPLIEGANDVAKRPGTLDMYVAGRNSAKLAIFAPYVNPQGKLEAIVSKGTVDLNHVSDAVDARALAFSEDGKTLYVATRRPDALHIFQLNAQNAQTGAGISHDLVRSIPLGDQPSELVLHKRGAQQLIYVPCYDDRAILVLDAVSGVVIERVALDERPYRMVIDQGSTRCQSPDQPCRAYVTLFADARETYERCDDSVSGCGSVAVIDLNPDSARYHKVIAKIH